MFVITGNRLLDGVVVFMAEASRWDEAIDQARLFDDQSAAAAIVEAQAHQSVVSLDVIAVVKQEDGTIVPDRLREKIRAFGPSI